MVSLSTKHRFNLAVGTDTDTDTARIILITVIWQNLADLTNLTLCSDFNYNIYILENYNQCILRIFTLSFSLVLLINLTIFCRFVTGDVWTFIIIIQYIFFNGQIVLLKRVRQNLAVRESVRVSGILGSIVFSPQFSVLFWLFCAIVRDFHCCTIFL